MATVFKIDPCKGEEFGFPIEIPEDRVPLKDAFPDSSILKFFAVIDPALSRFIFIPLVE